MNVSEWFRVHYLKEQMKTSDQMMNIMKHHEGVRYRPYLCPAHIWTIGVGHAMYNEQLRMPFKDRRSFALRPEDNRVWSEEEVNALFKKDLERFERGVLRLCPNNLNQPRFDALVSLSFNIGLGNLQRSSVRMRHNRGDLLSAGEAFMMWIKGGGKVLPGLVRRRKEEKHIYLTGLKEDES